MQDYANYSSYLAASAGESPKQNLDAFYDGLLNTKELEQLCTDIVHELNARGLLVWPSLGTVEEYGGQIVIVDTEDALWKPAREKLAAERAAEKAKKARREK